ncbi:hypothetical protein C8F04DRAFT_1181736 [Mycena alexandri]|uniref:Uncharacterized protein n=1 Tax=Mycena alexandri TaxID=1745969 RepID=A0AAD6SYM0_9AGAR|nr:hypothetical protein C8F04DRAFT_1181736 [Mycena alexandri]
MYPDCGHLLKAQGTLRTTVGWVPRPADPISFSGRDSRLRQRQLGGMGVWSCPIEQTPIVGTFRPRHAPSSNRGPTPAATPARCQTGALRVLVPIALLASPPHGKTIQCERTSQLHRRQRQVLLTPEPLITVLWSLLPSQKMEEPSLSPGKFDSSLTTVRVRVRFVDAAECREGEWRADATEILLALQKSISSVTGSAKIGTPDRLNSSYTEYFVEIIANKPVEMLAVSPELLVISQDNQLTLRVDAIQRLEGDTQPTQINPSGVLPPAPPLVATAIGELNAADRARPRVREPTQQEIEWLKKQLSTRPGYTQFDANHNKVLQNVEHVRYWRFAAYFSRVFHKQTWPQEISSPSKGISKGAIEKALNMSRSALLDATQMIEIIDRYTAERDDNYCEEVENEISISNEDVPKAATLKAFQNGIVITLLRLLRLKNSVV